MCDAAGLLQKACVAPRRRSNFQIINIMPNAPRCPPQAVVAIISNPVNSTVPIAAEVFKKAGTFDPTKVRKTSVCPLCSRKQGLQLSHDGASQPGTCCWLTSCPLLRPRAPCSFLA